MYIYIPTLILAQIFLHTIDGKWRNGIKVLIIFAHHYDGKGLEKHQGELSWFNWPNYADH